MASHFRGFTTPRPIDASTTVDRIIDELVRERAAAWQTRGVPAHLIRPAAKLASDWTRPTLAWHLEMLTGILPASTLTAIEVPLARRLTLKALDDMAERWLASAQH